MKIGVSGGTGFLGKALILRLLKEGHEVIGYSRRASPDIIKAGAKSIQVDISQKQAILDNTKNLDAFFHTAAIAGYWGEYSEYFQTNVIGTQNIIDACIENKIPRLVFTSSPSVVFSQDNLENVDESTPYPSSYLCHYSATKAEAEKRVMAANDNKALLTVSLRPHLIWGPGDNHLLPRIISKAKNKKLKIIGDGLNKVDIIYIDNAVEAHIKALHFLKKDSPLAGSTYFVSDAQEVKLWEWINLVLTKMNIPPIQKKISHSLAYNIGSAIEFLYKLLNIKGEPPMTRFMANSLATHHYFNTQRSKNDFEYKPIIGAEEGINNLIQDLKKNLKT